MKTQLFLIALLLGLTACGDDSTVPTSSDTGASTDSGTTDAGTEDTGTDDTSSPDAGTDAVGTADTGGVADVSDPGAPTWANFAEGFFAEFCVSCHSPDGQATADYREYSVVSLRLNAIRCGVSPVLRDGCEGEYPPGRFPIGNGPQPTEDERWLLVEWIEGGAPE